MNLLAQVRRTILLFRVVFVWVREKEEAQSSWDWLPEGIVLRVKTALPHNVQVSFWEAILQVLGDYSGCQLAFGTQCVNWLSLENEDLKLLISDQMIFVTKRTCFTLIHCSRRGDRVCVSKGKFTQCNTALDCNILSLQQLKLLLYTAKRNSMQIYLSHPQNSTHHCVPLPASQGVLTPPQD